MLVHPPPGRGALIVRRLLSIALGLLCSAALAAPATRLVDDAVQVEVLDSGRYRILQRQPHRADRASTLGFSSVVATELLSGSTQVPLRLGEAFGFRFRLRTHDVGGEWLPLQIVIRHPALIDVRGRLSEGFVIDSAARRDDDGSYRNGAFYVLSDARELVAGRWRIDLVHAGRTLVSREFSLEPDDDRMAGTQLAEPETWKR